MNRQEVFNKAVKGLAAQGFQSSRNKDKTCRYRGPEGLKCAVGHLIPDEVDCTPLEGDSVYFRGVIDLLNTLGYNVEAGVTYLNASGSVCYEHTPDVRFLFDLQKAHDNACNAESMKDCLTAFAQKYNLSTEVLSP